jgi:pilus assembly protein CpaC
MIGRTLFLALAVVLSSVVAAAPMPAAPQGGAVLLAMDVSTQRLLREPLPISRVAVANPDIADVSVINSRELLVNAKATGATTLMVWTGDGKAPAVQYRVEVAARSISGSTPDLLSHENALLAAGGSASAVAGGTGGGAGGGGGAAVADHTTVAVGTQVMSEVKVVDITRSALQEYGVNLTHFGNNGIQGVGGNGTINGFNNVSKNCGNSGGSCTITSSTGLLPIQSAFNFFYEENGWLGALSLLESKGLARTLAEPSLTAMSGQTATFLAGGEFPYPEVQGSGGGGNSITVVFKQFGIRLSLTPTVLARNRIALKVAPEVSELDYTNGVTVAGTTVPGLDVRRTDTTIELGDGETFVISGLISDTMKNNVDKIPWLGDVPVLGAFFRSPSINRSQRELIMVVTPHLVRPIAKNAALPPLPGAAMDHYDPSFAHTMFMESGDFSLDEHGYSR